MFYSCVRKNKKAAFHNSKKLNLPDIINQKVNKY